MRRICEIRHMPVQNNAWPYSIFCRVRENLNCSESCFPSVESMESCEGYLGICCFVMVLAAGNVLGAVLAVLDKDLPEC